jgi:cytochrome c-type biogenesis protein CcmH
MNRGLAMEGFPLWLVIPAKAAIQRLSPLMHKEKALDFRFRAHGGSNRGPAARRMLMPAVFSLLLAASTSTVFAQTGTSAAPLRFQSSAEEARFHALVSELRCVMCQNQSLADSNAQIAHDLRREVLELMRAGRSDAEIKDFLVARYGEFVLYRPRVEGRTWLLWLGPVALLLAGGVVVARIVRRRSGAGVPDANDEQEW